MWRPTRRDVLRGLGSLAGMGALGMMGCNGNGGMGDGGPGNGGTGAGGTGGGGAGGGGPATGGGAVLVRPNVMSPEGQAMLDLYRTAVEVMKGRPESDPTSWRAQARIHLDHCPHSNAFFLPWHRAYLHYFEQVVRAAAGDDGFALPYWDWTSHPTLPPAFWNGSLLDDTRQIGPDQPVPDTFVGPDVIGSILEINDFETFGSAYAGSQRDFAGTGRLEGTPHNNTHVEVGGRSEPVGNMSTFWSPLDPIFWLHHCNVDRLWVLWNQRHANGDNADWRSFEFVDNFVDRDGSPQSVRVDQLFSTEDLGYRYSAMPAMPAVPEGAVPAPVAATVLATAEEAVDAALDPGDTLRVQVALSQPLQRLLRGAGPEAGGSRTVRLTVGGIESPSAALPVSVYIGSEETPSGGPEHSGYVATFSFFPVGHEGHEAGHTGTQSFLFDVGRQVEALEGDSVNVHLEAGTLPAAPEAGVAPVIKASLVRLEVVGEG